VWATRRNSEVGLENEVGEQATANEALRDNREMKPLASISMANPDEEDSRE
jgi:hypothetical protein